MANNFSSVTESNEFLLLRHKPIMAEIIKLTRPELFSDLSELIEHIRKKFAENVVLHLIIPDSDVEKILKDPVYHFPQVRHIYIYCENMKDLDNHQTELKKKYPKLIFCLEDSHIPAVTEATDNAVHPLRPLDWVPVDDVTSFNTQRLLAKKSNSDNRDSSPVLGRSVEHVNTIEAYQQILFNILLRLCPPITVDETYLWKITDVQEQISTY
jgi:hypothetical protein